MITQNLHTNSLSSKAYADYLGYLEAIDAKDADKYGTYLSGDCTMWQNNQEPVLGKTAIVAGLREYWKTFDSLTHDLLNIYGTDDAYVLEAWNHYVRLDGKKVSVRAVAITERNENGLVYCLRFYTDVSPVFAESL